MSFGTKVGSSLGVAAAYAGHAVISAGKHTGQFGQDVVAGAKAGYTTKSAELAAQRATGYKPQLNRAKVSKAKVLAKA